MQVTPVAQTACLILLLLSAVGEAHFQAQPPLAARAVEPTIFPLRAEAQLAVKDLLAATVFLEVTRVVAVPVLLVAVQAVSRLVVLVVLVLHHPSREVLSLVLAVAAVQEVLLAALVVLVVEVRVLLVLVLALLAQSTRVVAAVVLAVSVDPHPLAVQAVKASSLSVTAPIRVHDSSLQVEQSPPQGRSRSTRSMTQVLW